MRVPAGGADHDAAAECEDGANIFDGGIGSGEVDDHVDAGKAGCGECRGMLILGDVECAHAVAAFARYLRNQ